VVNITPRPLYPRGENGSNHRTGSWVGSGEENLLPLLVFEPRTVQPMAISYTDDIVNNEWEIIGTEVIAG
jgi:hypothetical protein